MFEYADPSAKFNYKGPRSTNYQNKCADAFDKMYALLAEFDRKGNTPAIGYPYEELSLFLSGGDSVTDRRISELESAVFELKHTFHTYTGIVTGRQQEDVFSPDFSVINRGGSISAIPSDVRSRVDSSSSMKRRRSDEEYNTADEDSLVEGDFILPRDQRRKIARRENTPSSNKSYSFMTKNGGPLNKPPYKPDITKPNFIRREAVWGKKKSDPTSHFSGVARSVYVPQIFIYRCRQTTTADHVKHDLLGENIGVLDVKLNSHPDSKFRSFVVTVKTLEDFKKLINGDHIPENILVRKFRQPRPNIGNHTNSTKWYDNQVAELDAIGSELLVDNSAVIIPVQDTSSQPVQNSTVPPAGIPPTDELMTASQMSGSN